MRPLPSGASSIRVRLAVAMAVALLPVLLLGGLQAGISFHKEAQERRANLSAAAERSVAAARARLDGAMVILETVTPETVGLQCAPRLRQLMLSTPGVTNMVRLDRLGRVACAAGSVLGDRSRAQAAWFRRLEAGAQTVMDPDPPPGYTDKPAILLAARAQDSAGHFDGALAAFVSLASLRPEMDRAAPADTQVALIARDGTFLSQTNAEAFSRLPRNWLSKAESDDSFLYYGADKRGASRVYTITPLLGTDVFALLSAPSPSPFSWARLNLLSSVLFPLITFLAALAAVWVACDQVIVRWLHYVERVAAIYAKGRFSVRPVRADQAPPEIHELAATLEQMAEAIVSRDQSLRDSIAQKDALLREIHHRVKNNLQVITSLINLQQRSLDDPGARTALSDTRQRINALALIYRALYQGPDLRKVNLRGFLEELIAQLIMANQEATGPVQTELEADDLVVHPDKLAPLALFAVEAITNAQKHAFGEGGGELRVTFKVEGEEARLEIADSGQNPATTNPAGVGQTLMTAFARQLRGRCETVPNTWGGMTVRLQFPIGEADVAPIAQGRAKRNRAAA